MQIGRYYKDRNFWIIIGFVILPILLFGTVYTVPAFRKSDDIVFLLLSVFPFIFFVFFRAKRLTFGLSDYGWWIFIGWMFCSYFWATNPSMVLYYAFSWLILYLYVLMIRAIDISANNQQNLSYLFFAIFLLLLLSSLYVIFNGGIFPLSHLKVHRNVVAINLIALYAFILFTPVKGRFTVPVKVIISILLIGVLLYANSRGALLTLVPIFCIYGFTKLNMQVLRYSIGVLLGLALIFGVLMLIPEVRSYLFQFKIISEFTEANEWDRYYMLRNTFRLFKEAPFHGFGAGSWPLHIFSMGFDDFAASNYGFSYKHTISHNLFGKLLGELGLPGILAFCLAWVSPLVTRVRKTQTISAFQLSSMGVIVCLLSSSMFFALAVFLPFRFSPLLFLAILSLGFLQARNKYLVTPKLELKPRIVLITGAILSLSFFAYNYHAERYVYQNWEKREPAEVFIKKVEAIYHPALKTYFRNSLLPWTLAKKSARTHDVSRTYAYYEEAHRYDPHNVALLTEFASFILKQNGDVEKASALAHHAYQIYGKHFKTNLILADIAYRKQAYQEALEYLAFRFILEGRKKNYQKMAKKRALLKWEKRELKSIHNYLQKIIPLLRNIEKNITYE